MLSFEDRGLCFKCLLGLAEAFLFREAGEILSLRDFLETHIRNLLHLIRIFCQLARNLQLKIIAPIQPSILLDHILENNWIGCSKAQRFHF